MERKTILLVEDESIIALSEKRMLEKSGYEVIHVKDGESAVETGTGNPSIDLVLMDIDLGRNRMNGTEAAQKILDSRDLPILFLSSHGEKEVVERAQDISSYGYVTKGSGNAVLLASIQAALGLFDTNQKLKNHMAYVESILETTPDGFWIVSSDGRIEDVNNTYCVMSGYSREEILGKSILDFDACEKPDLVKSRMESLQSIDRLQFKTHHKRKDGSVFPVEITAKLTKGRGLDQYIVFCRDLSLQENLNFGLITSSMDDAVFTMARDVTDLQQAESTLEKQDKLLRTLFEQVPGGIYQFRVYPDGHSTVPFITRNFEEVYGVKADDVRDDATPVFSCIYEDDQERVMSSINRSKEELSSWYCDYRIRHPRKGIRWLRGQSSPEKLEDNSILWYGFLMDITDLKNTEQKLEDLTSRQKGILEGTNVGTWEWNVQTGETVFNERWAQIIGYTLQELEPVSIDTWMQYANPEDLVLSNDALAKHFSGEEPFYNLECRMRHKEGHWVWVHDRGKVISLTPDGKPEWMFGTHEDITDRKKMEMAVQKGLQEKKILLKEMQHRVINTFTIINSMISLLKDSESSPLAEAALEKIETKISSIGTLYNLLYSNESVETVYLDEYLERVIQTFQTDFGNISLISLLDPVVISVKQAISVGIIVNEMLTNAYKYAFPDNRAGIIRILMKKRDTSVEIRVEDDGVGIDFLKEQRESSFGRTMIFAMLEQLDAEMTATRDTGTSIRFLFPLDDAT